MANKQTPTVIGIDIGSYTAKLAAVQRGAVEIITNQANFRETPVVVGFGQGERKIGQIGNVKLKSNYKNTVLYPARYLGLSSNQQSIKKQLSYSPCSYKIQENTLLFKVDANGNQQNFTSQQILASFMTQLSEIINHNNLDDKLIVFSVPSFFTEMEKKALLNAASISGYKNVKINSDTVSLGLDYGSYKKSQMGQGKNVVFVDFGHSKLSVNLIKFTEKNMDVMIQKFNRNLGCRDIDRKIFEYIANKFLQSKGLDIKQNKKACLKLLQTIHKQRKILTGITQTDISIQCLMQDEDLFEPFTRQIMINESKQIFDQISKLLIQFKQQVQKLNLKIDSVQLIGGGSRIPRFIEIVQEVFGMNSSRTTNSSQTIARGACLAAVQQSGLFRFHSFKISNCSPYKILVNWKQIDQAIRNQDEQILIKQNEPVPMQKIIKIRSSKKTQVCLSYKMLNDQIEQKISFIEIQAPSQNKNEINIKFIVDEEGFISVSSIKDNQGNGIKFNYKQNKCLNSQKILSFKAKQRQMFVRDFQIVRGYEKKNELEGFIYKQKQLFNNEETKKFITTQDKQKIEKYLNEAIQNIHNNDKMQLKDYDNMRKQIQVEIKKLIQTSKKRKGELALHLKQLQDLKTQANETMKQITQRFRNTKMVSEIYQQIKQISNWAQEAIKVTKSKNINQLPVVPKKDIDQQFQNIKILVNQLVNPYKNHAEPESQRPQHQQPNMDRQRNKPRPNPYQQQHYQQQNPRQQQQRRNAPQQQYYDPFGMTRSGLFGGNNFFGNMSGFF